MKPAVHFFVAVARPAADNQKYKRWESAELSVFIAEDDHDVVLSKFDDILNEHRWELLYFTRKETLVEERVRSAGTDTWDIYERAQREGSLLFEQSHHFGAGDASRMPMVSPRINEAFVDSMIVLAGGRRLTQEECGAGEENADYLIGDCVLELKEIREEVFADDKVSRQHKLAELLIPYFPHQTEIRIDPGILSPEDGRRFDDLIGTPLKTAIKKAAGQIKATKARLKLGDWRGGVIFVNSGSYTIGADRLFDLAKRFASKDTSQIQEVVFIEQGFRTNSFDCWLDSSFLPPEPHSPLAARLMSAWSKQLTKLLDQWAISHFSNLPDAMDPPVPVQFVAEGRIFSWLPQVPAPSCLESVS
jgi:hypothetical protein